MSEKLYSPKKIEIPDRLVLVPHFHNRPGLKNLEEQAGKKRKLLGSRLLLFREYALLTGFMGYPHLLTLLEFISRLEEKRVFFLGTAGSLNPEWDRPRTLNVIEIHGSGVFTGMSDQAGLELEDLNNDSFQRARAVSVDILQRETRSWLKEQKGLGVEAVEMELFPLRIFLGRPFSALVVLSDRVTDAGIRVFKDLDRLSREFTRAFEYFVSLIKAASMNQPGKEKM